MSGTILGLDKDGVPRTAHIDDEGRVSIKSVAPVPVCKADGSPIAVSATDGRARTDDASWSKSITGSSQNAQLPVTDGLYLLVARGGDAYILTGSSAPTATTTAGSGYSIPILDGAYVTLRLTGNYIAWIGDGAGGVLSICLIAE